MPIIAGGWESVVAAVVPVRVWAAPAGKEVWHRGEVGIDKAEVFSRERGRRKQGTKDWWSCDERAGMRSRYKPIFRRRASLKMKEMRAQGKLRKRKGPLGKI
jgi:hypothetical protein